MSLINCPECNKEVSSNAPACPGCGCPIAETAEAKGSGVKVLTTTQETSKKFKLQSLISGAMLVIGFSWIIVASQAGGEPSAIPGLLIAVGLVWYLVNRFRIWWHHK